MRKITFYLLLIVSINSYSQIRTISDGSWDSKKTWSNNVVPNSTDNVVISHNIETKRNKTTSIGNVLVESDGSLIFLSSSIFSCTNLELKSISDNYPSLISNGVITGTVSYSRYTNIMGNGTTGANDLVSPPLSGQIFADFATANTNLAASGNLRAFGPFDNTNTAPGAYVNYDTGTNASAVLAPGIGLRAATIDGSNLVYTGNVETGDVLTPITVGSGSSWNLIGNPYPSYIRLDEFLAQNPGIMDASSSGVYGYDGAATDGWAIWNQAYSDAFPDALIAPGQGFFVKAAIGGGTVTFTPIMRSVGSSDDFIAEKSPKKLSELSNTHAKIQISDASKTYNTDFYFNDNASVGLDPGYDASLYEATAPEFSIYSHLIEDNTGKAMGIQSINPTDVDNVSIALGINTIAGKEITVSIAKSTFPAGIFVYLEDNVTNELTLLNESDYTFTPDEALTSTGRFFVSFKTSKVLGIQDGLENLNSLEIYTSTMDKALFIKGQITDIATVHLFDMQGRKVFSQKLQYNSNATQIDVANFSTGIYIVQIKGNNIFRTKKIFIQSF